MKIDYALMSCDTNPLYMDFIPTITKAWNRLNIKPIYVIISQNKNKKVDDGNSITYYFKKINSLSIVHQSQFARIWMWKKIKGNSIISDIDMIPISSKYFNGIANQYSENQIVSYCDDARIKFGQIAACYVLANHNVMNDLIIEKNWKSFITNRAKETGEGWGGDQWYLDKILNEYSNTIRLNRGWFDNGEAHNRLDRNTWVYNDIDIKNENIFDVHSLRPYSENKDKIEKIMNLLS